jgi:multiple sugar transport system permease protein
MERQSPWFKLFLYVAALSLGVFILAPILWMLLMSVSSTNDLTTIPLPWLPQVFDFHRYVELLSFAENSRGREFLSAMRNSILVAGIATICAILVAIPAAWSVSRSPGRQKMALYAVVATYMLPPVALVVPIYFALSAIGHGNYMLDFKPLIGLDLVIDFSSLFGLNSIFSLSAVYLTILAPFTTWLLKSSFDNIPVEIELAAMIDGARLDQILRRITLPLAGPSLATAGLFAFLLAWDEYFYAYLFTSTEAAKTLPVEIADLVGGRISDYGLLATAGVLAAVPPVLIGFFLQRSLIAGLTAGGVKG